MKVFLLRHAHATYGGPDQARPLSSKGITISRELASVIQTLPFYRYSRILSSPYLRARQTAIPFIALLSDPSSVAYTDALTPYADPHKILNEIRSATDNLLLIGHNPNLSVVATHLLGSATNALPITLKKAGLAVLKRNPYNESRFFLSSLSSPTSLGISAGQASR